MLTIIGPVHGTIVVEWNGGQDSATFPGHPGNTLTFDVDTAVTITATAAPSPYEFLNWAPDFVGEPNPLNLTLDEDEIVEAYFYDDPQFNDANLEAAVRHAVGNPSDPLTTAELEGITFLVAVGYGITDLTGLELCTNLYILSLTQNTIVDLTPLTGLTGLRALGLSDNQIADLTPLSGLWALEILYLDNNVISDVHPIEYLDSLNYLSLANNEIKYLGTNPFGDDWGIMANEGLGPGDTLELRGNPLSLWVVCEDVPTLEAAGVTVFHDADECLTDPVQYPDEDQDGDGFTNAEEWRYIQYYDNDADDQALVYRFLSTMDSLPYIDHACYEDLDVVAVTVTVIGEGSVFLGDGYATEGTPKTWDFARWDIGCADPCPTEGEPECGDNAIGLVATPSFGWHLDHWSGDASGSDTMTTLVMDDHKTVTAHFALPASYSLTIESVEHGSTSPDPGTYTYDEATYVSVLATVLRLRVQPLGRQLLRPGQPGECAGGWVSDDPAGVHAAYPGRDHAGRRADRAG